MSRTTSGDWVAFQPSKAPDRHHFTYHLSGQTHYKGNVKGALPQAMLIETSPSDLLGCQQLFIKSFENFATLLPVKETHSAEVCEIDLGADYAMSDGLVFAEVLIGRRFQISESVDGGLQVTVLKKWRYCIGPDSLELRVHLASALSI